MNSNCRYRFVNSQTTDIPERSTFSFRGKLSCTMTAVALTIAGSDSSGGAGIQADLKTFAAFAVFGTSAITAITAQNTRGVSGVANLDPAFVAAQIDAVADDFTIAAAKTGMLSRGEIIGTVANRIRIRKIPNFVVDPVMVAASGDVLLEPDAITMMREVMLPLATVVTPNLREASILTGRDVSNRDRDARGGASAGCPGRASGAW